MTAEGHPHDPPCKKCGQTHLTRKGLHACHSHIYNSDPPIPCRAAPLDPEYGTLCGKHGGKARQVKMAAAKRRGLAEIGEDINKLGFVLDVEPSEAMIIMVRESAANVVYLRGLVQQLQGSAGNGPIVIGEDGEATVDNEWNQSIAHRTDPDNFKQEAHILVRMYNDERDRLVRYSKLCRDAGVDERIVQVAEAQGQWLANTLDRVFEMLELNETQREQLPAIMSRVVAELEAPPA